MSTSLLKYIAPLLLLVNLSCSTEPDACAECRAEYIEGEGGVERWVEYCVCLWYHDCEPCGEVIRDR